MVLMLDVRSAGDAGVQLVCSSMGGTDVASIRVDPSGVSLSDIQAKFTRQLGISQTRLRLVLPGPLLPTEADNVTSLAELFRRLRLRDIEVCCPTSTEELAPSDIESNLALNELSCSSHASASTCASQDDLRHMQLKTCTEGRKGLAE